VRVCLLSKDDARRRIFPMLQKKARSRRAVLTGREPRQQRSAPIDAQRRGGEVKEQRRILGRINADAALDAGLGWAVKLY
jgi:hypothetical protein